MHIGYFEGVIQLANVFLALAAGALALTLFNKKFKGNLAWKPLIIALLFFALEEIFGALRSFQIFSTPYITHIIPSIMVGFIIYALVLQIILAKGCKL